MILKLDMNSTVPIYVQLRNQIVMGIGHGELKEGERLPTVKTACVGCGSEYDDVNKTYQILKAERIYTDRQAAGGDGCTQHYHE